MFMPVRFNRPIYLSSLQQARFLNNFSSKIAQQVKKIALITFTKFSNFFNSFNQQPYESNLKAFALVSCLSLIALLVISILQQRDSNLINAIIATKSETQT